MSYAIENSTGSREFRFLREQLGLSRKELAELMGVTVKSVERWETAKEPVSGTPAVLRRIFREFPDVAAYFEIPDQEFPLRIWYMRKNERCTMIDVDEKSRRVHIRNYTTDYLDCAFGKNEHPTYEEYLEFLESRCFPQTRDKMKLMLEELDLPFYDPMMIIEKTEGRMAEDDFHLQIERL